MKGFCPKLRDPANPRQSARPAEPNIPDLRVPQGTDASSVRYWQEPSHQCWPRDEHCAGKEPEPSKPLGSNALSRRFAARNWSRAGNNAWPKSRSCDPMQWVQRIFRRKRTSSWPSIGPLRPGVPRRTSCVPRNG